MSLKLTLKRKLGLLRKTAKKYLKSGGGELSATASEFITIQTKPTVKGHDSEPSNIKKIANNISLLDISNSSKNGKPSLMNEWSKLKERIENAVAIDCEMVGVGRQSVLAHVAIVDFNGKRIYDKYVIPKGGIESITDYRTKFSGITPAKLERLDKKKHSFEIVKKEVHKILQGKIIVGHGLINDFKVLEYVPRYNVVWDSTEIDMFKQNHPQIPGLRQPRKLKAIAKEFANNNIQLNTKSGHSPLEDARASMNLYRVSVGYPKVTYANMST